MSESSAVTAPIIAALKDAGYFVLRLNSGRVRQGKYWIQLCPEGTADILLCPRDSMPIWIETKVKGGWTKPERREKQDEFRRSVEGLGHIYVRAESLDDVLAALRQTKAASF